MLLIFDTSRSKTFVTLALDQKKIKTIIWDADLRHSEELLPKISKLLEENKLSVNRLKGISIISGPGSYTGLRVGVACANALGYALNIPTVGINKLELLANLGLEYLSRFKNLKQGKIYLCSLVLAVSNQFFAAIYRLGKKQQVTLEQIDDFFVGNIKQLGDLIKGQTIFLVEKEVGSFISFTLKKNLSNKFLGIKYFDLFDDRALKVLVRLSFEKLKGRKVGGIITPLYIRKPHITE